MKEMRIINPSELTGLIKMLLSAQSNAIMPSFSEGIDYLLIGDIEDARREIFRWLYQEAHKKEAHKEDKENEN